MYRTINKIGRTRQSSIDPQKILHRLCQIDQFATQSFNLSDFGYPRNSIAAMAHAQSYEEYKAIASMLQTSPREFNIPKGTKFEDAIRLVRPRSCQSPAELEIFANNLADLDMEKANDAYLKALEDVKVDKKSASKQETVETKTE